MMKYSWKSFFPRFTETKDIDIYSETWEYQLFRCYRWNIQALGVNAMPADALATLGASAGMVLSV